MTNNQRKNEVNERLKIINQLLKKKKVTIQDDYTHDVFTDKNGKELFSVMSSRGFYTHQEKEIETLDIIITNLKHIQ